MAQPVSFQVRKLEVQEAKLPSAPEHPVGTEGPVLLGEEPDHILEGHASWSPSPLLWAWSQGADARPSFYWMPF